MSEFGFAAIFSFSFKYCKNCFDVFPIFVHDQNSQQHHGHFYWYRKVLQTIYTYTGLPINKYNSNNNFVKS